SIPAANLPSIRLLTIGLFCNSSEYLVMSCHKISLLKEKVPNTICSKTSHPSKFSTAFRRMASTLETSTPNSSIGSCSSASRFNLSSCFRYSTNVLLFVVSSTRLRIVYFDLADLLDSYTDINNIGAKRVVFLFFDSYHFNYPNPRYKVLFPFSS